MTTCKGYQFVLKFILKSFVSLSSRIIVNLTSIINSLDDTFPWQLTLNLRGAFEVARVVHAAVAEDPVVAGKKVAACIALGAG